MAGHGNFLWQFLTNRDSVGAVAPSSKGLGRAITAPARAVAAPRRWLEVGPGTGVFTRQLIAAMGEDDHLDVVELNEAFCAVLERDVLPAAGDRAVLHAGSILDVPLPGAYDALVCGLPFNAFPTHVSRAMVRRLIGMLKPGGTLSYFEYAGIRRVRSVTGSATLKRAMFRHEAFVNSLKRDMKGRRDLVMMNMPPAWAVHLTKEQ